MDIFGVSKIAASRRSLVAGERNRQRNNRVSSGKSVPDARDAPERIPLVPLA